MAGKDSQIFVWGHCLLFFLRSEKFPSRVKLEKNVSFKDWIMSKEVYIRVYFFKSNGGLFVYYLSNIVWIWKLGNIPQIFPSLSWSIFSRDALRFIRCKWKYLIIHITGVFLKFMHQFLCNFSWGFGFWQQ